MPEYTPEQFDDDTRRYLDLAEVIEVATSEMSAIKARLRVLGTGAHESPSGVQVTVTAPNRSFSLTKAVALLNEEQLLLCKADGYDGKKVKSLLPPVLLDLCMEAGSGDARVSVK